MSKRVVVIGGVAGGASAAARLRRLDESAQITMVERDSYISFANCGLPYHIGGRIKERERLLVQTPEAMRERFNIDVRVRHEALAIDRNAKTVSIKDLDAGATYDLPYDFLILSPGATAIKPPIEGLEGDNVFVLRNIPDTDMMRDFVEKKRPGHATVIGGGFIGVEIAENLRERGLKVTLVEIADQVLGFLDYEMAAFIHEELVSKGIDLRLKDGIAKVERSGGGTFVVPNSGARVKTDMIALGLGVRPDSKLAKQAGLETAPNGAIIVDEHMRTSDPSILAVGDAVQIRHFVTGEPAHIPLAGPANKQGRIAADVIFGLDSRYHGTQGTSVVKVFDLAAASTGVNEKMLKRMGREYHAIHIHPSSHAGYYPGSTPMALKLLFSPDGTILGAQGVGASGVDKRIDVIATAMRLGAKVSDLENLELAYAPPYSSAKDPVNMAGYVAGNVLSGRIEMAQWHEIDGRDPDNTVVLDVREPEEREMGFIEGSINIPLNRLRTRLDELPRDKEIIVYCYVGLRAYYAARILMQNGFRIRNLSGGWRTYKTATGGKWTNPPPNEQGEPAVARDPIAHLTIDACGLQCPGPIMQLSMGIKKLHEGQILRIDCTDPGFARDVGAWCESTRNTLLKCDKFGDKYVAFIRKGLGRGEGQPWEATTGSQETEKHLCPPGVSASPSAPTDKTIIVYSGDLDKALAAFVIANGAASMDCKVTMFFTFWGLNILRKPEGASVKKPILDRMFGWMMPRGSKKLKLSKLNMMGMGTKMMRYVMRKKNVDSLETLIDMARAAGVRLVACQMSMDVMGLRPEELMDGVEVGGVATMLNSAEKSNMALFI